MTEHLPAEQPLDEVMPYRGEDGIFNPYVFGASLLTKRAGKIAAALLGIVGFAGSCSALEAGTDLNAAHTSASIKQIVWKPNQAIDPATVYFEEVFNGEGIRENITFRPAFGHGPDVVPDPEVNKQLHGIGQGEVALPFKAITQSKDLETGKVNLTVDLSKTEMDISWAGAGPSIVDYTISGGKKNFSDRSGFRNSLLDSLGGNLKLINLDTIGNTLDDLDANIDHDIKLKGLDVFGGCAQKPKMLKQLENLSDRAIRANAGMLGRAQDIGRITFTNEKLGIKVDTGKKAADATGDTYEHSYQLSSGDFEVDEINCNVDKSKVANG